MVGVLAEVIGQVSPAAADADHHALALADETDKEFDWLFAASLCKVV